MAYLLAMGGHRLELTQEKMSFGSSSENDVPIPENFKLADKHFDLISTGSTDTYRLEVCPEVSEVFVNGASVTQSVLNTSDELRAGDLIVTFHAEPKEAAASSPFDPPTSNPTEEPKPAAIAPAIVGSAPVLDFGGSASDASLSSVVSAGMDRHNSGRDSISGRKKGRMALVGGIAIAILGGGVFAAQQTGVLDYALNGAPEDNFEFLSENLPSGLDAYMTFDLGKMISAYPEIAANSDDALPPLDVISGMTKQHAGFQPTGLDRITMVSDIPTKAEIDQNLKGLKTLSASVDFGSVIRSKCIANFHSEADTLAFAQTLKSQDWSQMIPPGVEMPKLNVSVKGTQAVIDTRQDLAALKKSMQGGAAIVNTEEFGEPRTQEN